MTLVILGSISFDQASLPLKFILQIQLYRSDMRCPDIHSSMPQKQIPLPRHKVNKVYTENGKSIHLKIIIRTQEKNRQKKHESVAKYIKRCSAPLVLREMQIKNHTVVPFQTHHICTNFRASAYILSGEAVGTTSPAKMVQLHG